MKYKIENEDFNVPRGTVLYNCARQRHAKRRGELKQRRVEKLEDIGLQWEFRKTRPRV